MKKLIPILLIFVAAGAYIYYELLLKNKISGSTLVDNPTQEAIHLSIDGKPYDVPAEQYLKVELSTGKHLLTCDKYGLKDQHFVLEPTQYGVINPTKSKYVIYNTIYSEKDMAAEFRPYQVEGREVYSVLDAPRVVTDLFIPDLTLGKGNIDNKEPSVQSYNRFNKDYSFLTRIFRLDDFFIFYDKNNR